MRKPGTHWGDYETEELGLGLALGFPLAPDKRLRTSYSLYTSQVKADSNATTYELLLAGTDTISSIGAIFTLDRRNSPYKPSRGTLLRFDSSLAGIGGTANYIKEKDRPSLLAEGFYNMMISTDKSVKNNIQLGGMYKTEEENGLK